MKIKIAEAPELVIDFLVAKCEGRKPGHYLGVVRATAHPDFPDSPPMFGPELRYSTDWAQGGPIIEREGISTVSQGDGHEWIASLWDYETEDWRLHTTGPTPLIAAMRCYIYAELGDEVEVPEELCTS